MFERKLTLKERLEIAKLHVDQKVPFSTLHKKFKYDISNMKYICALYRKHGEKVFLLDEIQKYTRELKLNVIKRIIENKETCWAIGIELGIKDPTVIRDWVKKFKKEGPDGIQDSASRHAYLKHNKRILNKEYSKLVEDLEITKAENEYLKNLYSLILNRSKDDKKHK